jgi:UrcA family protein
MSDMLRRYSCIALAAAGLGVGATAALAQDYGPPPPGAYVAPPEDVIVVAPHVPRFREEGSGPRLVNMPPEKISLSTNVRYDDLDLVSGGGARELRWRVSEAAHHVCGELREAYPLRQLQGTRCYRDALENGLIRANEAIATARHYAWYGYAD